MALDGGSTQLQVEANRRKIILGLEWSIVAQKKGQTRFLVDGREVTPGSPEEASWIARVREAASRMPAYDPNRPMERKGLILLSGRDLEYLKAMEQGAMVALGVLAVRFAELVESDLHQRVTPVPAEDPVRALVAEGRLVEAMQAYRKAHPEASTAEARDAIRRMLQGQ